MDKGVWSCMMTMSKEDLERLQDFPRILMLLADCMDASKGVIGDKGQQDLRWLSEQIDKLIEDRGRAWFRELRLESIILDRDGQLSQAQAEVERLTGFCKGIIDGNWDTVTHPIEYIEYIRGIARQVLIAKEIRG